MDRGENALRRRRSLVDRALAMEIESLRKLKTKALKARYRELFGEESRSLESGALISPDCLAFTGQSRRRSE